MMKTGLIIFARFSSSRLPGKALLSIDGRPLLGRVFDRTRRVNGRYDIVLATSDREDDDPLAQFAEDEGIQTFRGALDDVAGRALACCKAFGFERFVRICGDRPFLDPTLINVLLDHHEKKSLDLATNAGMKTFPAGVATEIVLVDALERAVRQGLSQEDREHVTKYFYDNSSAFRIFNLESSDPTYRDVNLSVDTLGDLYRASWIASQLDEPESASLDQVVVLARAWLAQNKSK